MIDDPEQLSPEDVKLFKSVAPTLRAVQGFGIVMKWLAISALGLLAGVVLLGESVMKIVGWFWPPPPIH